MKRGFSALSAILLVLLLLVLGAGGYTGYKYFTDANFDFYGLMPKAEIAAEEEMDKEATNEESETDEEGEDESAAMKGAKDALRKADLNNVIAAVETYANDNGSYPQGTRCVDEMEELKTYFKGGVLPADDAGEQVFETEDGEVSISCPGGYLYQDFGDGEYLVWAKADDDTNGNSEYLVTDKAEAVKGESGVYIFHGSVVGPPDEEETSDGGVSNPLANFFPGGAGEVNTRDTTKKMDINSMIAAIETYNADYMEYPQKTACVDQMDELQEYLRDGDRIFEDGGEAVFETEDGSVSITCEGGYLYQSFGDGNDYVGSGIGNGYVVWTTMENEENGNMRYFVTNQSDVAKGDGGKYFIYSSVFSDPAEMLPFEGEDEGSVVKTGVPRGVSRTAE